ncbi:restriction endonuclease subunit S [Providencia sp. PROV032]|uniref:restriction endonuclease subunit S n=1 Tax=Providencia sp. PROV032 TaxID=2949764 RepID=UPI00234961BF|nr:restriction endonuclease subunit S [Providencia sp. PROV032]
MGSEWPLVKLGDYCCKIGSGATPKGGSSVYLDSGDVCLIRSQNIYNEGFDEGGLVYIDEIAATKLRNVVVEHNDILLNITGDSVARVCLVPDAYLPARVNQHVAIIRPNVKHFDARFLRYFLASPKTQILLLNLSSAGATRNALTKSMIENFEVPKPSLDVQAFIANILQSLDNKIISNRQINQTLEQMAQTLFKSWFVDFDPVIDNALDTGFFEQDLVFSEELLRRVEVRKIVRESEDFKALPEDMRQLFPDAFEEDTESILGLGGWVPKGWGISKLSDFGNIICGKTPSKKEKNFYGNDIPFIKIPDMHGNVFITKTSDNLSFEGGKSQIKKLIPEGSICVSSIATVGLVSITTEPAHTNQQINSIVPQHKYFRDYLYFSLLNKNKHFHDLASGGSTTLNMNTTLFSNVLFIQPDKPILELFQRESGRFLERIKHSLCEIAELTKLRDTLLPKLISGELSLNDIKIDLPEETLI